MKISFKSDGEIKTNSSKIKQRIHYQQTQANEVLEEYIPAEEKWYQMNHKVQMGKDKAEQEE